MLALFVHSYRFGSVDRVLGIVFSLATIICHWHITDPATPAVVLVVAVTTTLLFGGLKRTKRARARQI